MHSEKIYARLPEDESNMKMIPGDATESPIATENAHPDVFVRILKRHLIYGGTLVIFVLASIAAIVFITNSKTKHEKICGWSPGTLSTAAELFNTDQVTDGQDLLDCGSDPKTALDRGCLFDSISFTWQRPECYDHE